MKRNRQMFFFIGVLCVALLSGLVTGVSSAHPTSNTQLHQSMIKFLPSRLPRLTPTPAASMSVCSRR